MKFMMEELTSTIKGYQIQQIIKALHQESQSANVKLPSAFKGAYYLQRKVAIYNTWTPTLWQLRAFIDLLSSLNKNLILLIFPTMHKITFQRKTLFTKENKDQKEELK